MLARRTAGSALLAITLVVALVAGATAGRASGGDGDATPAEVVPGDVVPGDVVPGEIVVAFVDGTTDARAAELLAAAAVDRAEPIALRTQVVQVGAERVDETLAALRANPDVRAAEPNFLLHATVVPNDPRFAELYGMTKVGAPAAWDASTGDGSAVVAVLDTGILATHPDLNDNMWANTVGLWGCATGTFGWDSYNNDCNPTDDHGHGTHVSGTIGGEGNNATGVAGVSWDVQLMGLKVLSAGGSGSMAQIVDGIDRAVAARNAGVNVRVISASLGGTGTSTILHDAVERAEAAGIVFVAAAGNSTLDVGTTPVVPCIYATICVAATDANDARASFSNYGTPVDVAAPGVNTVSTYIGNAYTSLSGTSMATPHVSGAIALLAQTDGCRDMSVDELAGLVLETSATVPGLGIDGNRRLDVGGAVASCDGVPPFSVSIDPSSATIDPGESVSATVSVTAGDAAPLLELSASGLPSGATVAFDPSSVAPGGSSTMTVSTNASVASGSSVVKVTAAETGTAGRSAYFGLTVRPITQSLTNGVPDTASGAAGSEQFWKLDVPAGQTSLAFTISGGTGDADLYVRRGDLPTTAAYDCRPYLGGNNETCTFTSPQAGTWYVMLRGFAAYAGVSVLGSYPAQLPNTFSMALSPTSRATLAGGTVTSTVSTALTGGSPHAVSLSATNIPGISVSFSPPSITTGQSATMSVATSASLLPGAYVVTVTGTGAVTRTATFTLQVAAVSSLSNGVPVTASGAASSQTYWKLEVPAGQSSLTFSISGGTGDADLYVGRGSLPTTASYDCRPYLGGNNETCTFSSPQAGTWYVMIRGFSEYANVSLQGTSAGSARPLVNNKYTKNVAGTAGSEQFFVLHVPAGQRKVTFNMHAGKPNADLYVRFGSLPTTSGFTCRSTKANNEEKCEILAPAPGSYYVMVRGATSFTKTSVRGTYMK